MEMGYLQAPQTFYGGTKPCTEGTKTSGHEDVSYKDYSSDLLLSCLMALARMSPKLAPFRKKNTFGLEPNTCWSMDEDFCGDRDAQEAFKPTIDIQ